MAFHHIDVTMTGSTKVIAAHTPVKQVIIYNPTGNASVLVGDKHLSASSYGFQVAAASAGPPIGPLSGELSFNLEEIYVRGTDAQVVHVAYLT